MRGKVLFALGLGVGYIFGTRAGRARYNQMKSAALKVWNDPRVQEQVSVATEFVKDKAPEVADFVAANAKKVAAKVDEARGTKPAAQPATTTKPKASTKTTTASESESAGK
ncbi:MAG: YtxH domain-containing protein [Microbacteriaceae bacterium]